jgi:hypothetical protein
LTKSYYEELWEKLRQLWVEDIRMEYFERDVNLRVCP